MWSVVHVPLEYGPLTPVIRGNPWRLNPGAVSDDWEYVTFAWDNILAAYMLSIDAKDLGYSALIQVVKSKHAEGYIPNFKAGIAASGNSQPPLAGRVLLEMLRAVHKGVMRGVEREQPARAS